MEGKEGSCPQPSASLLPSTCCEPGLLPDCWGALLCPSLSHGPSTAGQRPTIISEARGSLDQSFHHNAGFNHRKMSGWSPASGSAHKGSLREHAEAVGSAFPLRVAMLAVVPFRPEGKHCLSLRFFREKRTSSTSLEIQGWVLQRILLRCLSRFHCWLEFPACKILL